MSQKSQFPQDITFSLNRWDGRAEPLIECHAITQYPYLQLMVGGDKILGQGDLTVEFSDGLCHSKAVTFSYPRPVNRQRVIRDVIMKYARLADELHNDNLTEHAEFLDGHVFWGLKKEGDIYRPMVGAKTQYPF